MDNVPGSAATDSVIEEIVELRRRGFRFIALADDNFYPVTLTDIALAKRQNNQARVDQLEAMREERFELMERLSELPKDMTFFTQITMEAAEDTGFLDAMKKARIRGALVGVEAVTAEGLKSVYKDFNLSGDNLVKQLKTFSDHGVHVLGSFIFGLPSDRPDTFDATQDLAQKAGLTFAQFVMLTPFPGTVDFEKWEKAQGEDVAKVDGIPLTRYWLIPAHKRPKMFMPHPTMNSEEMRARTQGVWDRFYSFAFGLEAVALHAPSSRAPGVRLYLETVPADVRQHRHRYRQRPPETRQRLGPLAGDSLPQAVLGSSHAGPADAARESRGAGLVPGHPVDRGQTESRQPRPVRAGD